VKQVLGVIGSARKNGNTQVLVERILEGAKYAGAETETIDLRDLKVQECDGCHQCWHGKKCVKNDDMNLIFDKISASDVIVFGTPVYWFGPTALMKCFLDRFVYFNCPENRQLVRGKRVILAVPFEDAERETAAPLVEIFRRSVDYLEMEMYGIILVPGVTRRGEAKEKKDEMDNCFDLGKKSVL
jgi:multimeric flavodoxin WrbA